MLARLLNSGHCNKLVIFTFVSLSLCSSLVLNHNNQLKEGGTLFSWLAACLGIVQWYRLVFHTHTDYGFFINTHKQTLVVRN